MEELDEVIQLITAVARREYTVGRKKRKLRRRECKHYSYKNCMREVGNTYGRRMESEEEEEAWRTAHKEEHPYCNSTGRRGGT
jgi:hypothetical protein